MLFLGYRDLEGLLLFLPCDVTILSTAADRPARRSDSAAHARPIYSISDHMVIKQFLLLGLAAEYRSWRWIWSTCRRPSDVYDTHRRTKLTAPETISRSRDMVDAHQNLNGLHDLTRPLAGMVYHPRAIAQLLATNNLPTKFEVSISTHYEDIKGDTKC